MIQYKAKKGVQPFRFWAGRNANPEIYFVKEEGELPEEIFNRISKKIITEIKEVKETENVK